MTLTLIKYGPTRRPRGAASCRGPFPMHLATYIVGLLGIGNMVFIYCCRSLATKPLATTGRVSVKMARIRTLTVVSNRCTAILLCTSYQDRNRWCGRYTRDYRRGSDRRACQAPSVRALMGHTDSLIPESLGLGLCFRLNYFHYRLRHCASRPTAP